MKRRVNTKFLMIVTVTVVSVCVGGFVLKRLFFKPRPDQAMHRAEMAANDGNWEVAAIEYERAFQLSYPKNAEILVKQGDMLTQLTSKDPASYGRDQRSWRRALEVDPKNKNALQRLIKAMTDQLEFFPS